VTDVDFLDRVDPELRATLEALPELDLSRNIPKLREVLERRNAPLRAALPAVPEVTTSDHVAPGDHDVRVRLYERADRTAPSAALVWIHGGGMVIGSLDGDDFLCKTMARDTGCLVASVDYRLAPEHPHPAHVDDSYAALRWLATRTAELGIDPSRIAIGGASAGGGIAAGTALLARDRGEVALCFQYLIYPMIDDRAITSSNGEITFTKVWNRDANRLGWTAYLGDRTDGRDVALYAAPARATVEDLRGLPSTYIDVGELDPFRDEDIAYATLLLQAGVPCELHVTPGAFHGSEAMVIGAASSKRIRSYRKDALRRALGSPAN
jgi:acetyl esterase/lipase